MSKLKVVISATVLLILILVGGFYWFSHRSGKGLRESVIDSAGDADLSMKGIDYVQTKNGRKEWRLIADEAHFLKKTNEAQLKNVKLIYFTKDKKEVTLRGNEGLFNTDTHDVAVWGDVKVITQEGYVFQTNYVKYMADSKEIQSSEQVSFQGPGFQVNGKGMRVSLNEEKLFLSANVAATVKGAL